MEGTSMYDTIEHDMRHSKEYLSNIKFNYIEILHKSILLNKVVDSTESVEKEAIKPKLIQRKKEVEGVRETIERLSKEEYFLKRELEERVQVLAQSRAQEAAVLRRIEELLKQEKTLKEFAEIKENNEDNLKDIKELAQQIEQADRQREVSQETLQSMRAQLKTSQIRKVELEQTLQTTEKVENQQIIYQYSWYKKFYSLFTAILGVKVVDVREVEHKVPESTYNSTCTAPCTPKVHENDVSVKILAKKQDQMISIGLLFVDGKVSSYTIHATPSIHLSPAIDELFAYCKYVNSTKFFLLEGSFRATHSSD
ncbi:hypothetical protein NEDG_01512 [Nematocida displodere]|uniref:Uncharacterized protein n=1 Tax=Nematocida displodere TaxID=1805483 RepID=A0A177EDD9_9MICR|nr:hypothetical protein NEDG_01512 [Nematocida displodere]